MTERRLGIGVVGIGWVAHPKIDAWHKHPHCDVVALCSHDRANAEAAVARHGLTPRSGPRSIG
jgi:predicted dehydrogenase